ncbi:hypothetical protein KSP39_PZI010540 [Platanthera zijinensis]|uniref:Uncharacterized protein n=1 Tax=Platanthera zijinensis TaxID=2320716 RepID=A0AAP0BJV7_9ASPA
MFSLHNKRVRSQMQFIAVENVIILTSSPLEGGFAVAICTFPNQESFLASARPGDDAWSLVFEFDLPDQGLEGDILETIEDVVYHKGDEEMLYALSHWRAVMILKHSNNGSWDLHSMVATADFKHESGRTTFCDAGVYDMESKTIEPLLCPSNCRHSVWFMPTQSLWD